MSPRSVFTVECTVERHSLCCCRSVYIGLHHVPLQEVSQDLDLEFLRRCLAVVQWIGAISVISSKLSIVYFMICLAVVVELSEDLDRVLAVVELSEDLRSPRS